MKHHSAMRLTMRALLLFGVGGCGGTNEHAEPPVLDGSTVVDGGGLDSGALDSGALDSGALDGGSATDQCPSSPTPGNLITGFDPPTEQNLGKHLTVFGNFEFPLTNNNLSIDGIPITPVSFLLGSSASQLVFKVPESIEVAQNGSKCVVVRIGNAKGIGERNYVLKPVVAAAPDPTIASIVNDSTSSSTLRIGKLARIVGQNFASPATNNRVRLIFNDGTGSAVAYPSSTTASLGIDPGSVIVAAPADSTLLVKMPDSDDTIRNIMSLNQPVSATIEVTAQGANNWVKLSVAIVRTE